jgi:hypothetical protein
MAGLPADWCMVSKDSLGRCSCTGILHYVDCTVTKSSDKILVLVLFNIIFGKKEKKIICLFTFFFVIEIRKKPFDKIGKYDLKSIFI